MWPFVCLFSFQWLVCLHNSLTPARILELGIESNLTWRSNNLETFGSAAEARPGTALDLTLERKEKNLPFSLVDSQDRKRKQKQRIVDRLNLVFRSLVRSCT